MICSFRQFIIELGNMKLVIGFITYNELTSKYLPFFLPILKEALATAFGVYQAADHYQIVAVDNSTNQANDNQAYIESNFPDINLSYAEANLGFARAYNLMIEQAEHLGAEYFLMINPDTVLAPNSILKLMEALDADQSLGAVAPRILQWDFAHNTQTNIIDSDGLFITSSHRSSDRHQGQVALPAEPQMVFGFTGAAALIRLKALVDIASADQYLDELMFMYKEDVDLSYRLQLANWPIKLIPDALVYHDRTASPMGEGLKQIIRNRHNKSRSVKRWSFLNQWILVLKYVSLGYSWKVKFRTWRYQLLSLFFVILFEPYLLGELAQLWRHRAEIRAKRQSLKIVVNPNNIEKMMDN